MTGAVKFWRKRLALQVNKKVGNFAEKQL